MTFSGASGEKWCAKIFHLKYVLLSSNETFYCYLTIKHD